MNYNHKIIISCIIFVGCLISRFDSGYGYFEYKYYCDIQSSSRITITTKEITNKKIYPCLTYVKQLNQNIATYSEQIKIAQMKLQDTSEFSGYRNAYLDEIQPKLLQSKILHIQIIKAMDKFEQDLFRKTMIYINYRYKANKKNLIKNITRRNREVNNAIQQGDSEAIIKINERYRLDKLKLETLNLMMQATNFKELMPFYNQFKELGK